MTDIREDWDFYTTHVNDKPASIYVNLALIDVAPDKERPSLLIVWLYLQQPNVQNGLSTQQEFDQLVRIEDVLVPAVNAGFSAIYAGRITNDGRREFYFYSNKTEQFEAKVSSVLSEFADYKFDAWTVMNADWDQYLNLLYPTQNARRWIGDRRVIEQLESHGDINTKSRLIEHWAYFSTEFNREQFEQSIKKSGFSTREKFNSEDGEMALGIVFSKTQTTLLDAIYETTSLLEKEAAACQGQYDGWESPVVTDEDGEK